MYLFLKISFPSARDLSFEETEVYHVVNLGSRINMEMVLNESKGAGTGSELSPEEVRKYQELAIKGLIVQATAFQEWLSEAYGTHTNDIKLITNRIHKYDLTQTQAQISDMYNSMELLSQMVDFDQYDIHEQEVYIRKWRSFNLHSLVEELGIPLSTDFDEMKQKAKALFKDLREKTQIEAFRNSFAKNYEKVDGKLEKRVDIISRIREFFTNDRFENAMSIMDEQIASRAEPMMEHSVRFNEDELAVMLLEIYKVLKNSQLELEPS